LEFLPGLAPAGDFIFLPVQENEAKEARPTARVPPLRSGQPAVLQQQAAPQNSLRAYSAALKQLRRVSSQSGCAT